MKALAALPLSAALLLLLAACDQRPVSWDSLLLQRLAQERPDCSATAPSAGRIELRCDDAPLHTIDVGAIALLCQRGPRDCGYAIDSMLLALPAPAVIEAPQPTGDRRSDSERIANSQ